MWGESRSVPSGNLVPNRGSVRHRTGPLDNIRFRDKIESVVDAPFDQSLHRAVQPLLYAPSACTSCCWHAILASHATGRRGHSVVRSPGEHPIARDSATWRATVALVWQIIPVILRVDSNYTWIHVHMPTAGTSLRFPLAQIINTRQFNAKGAIRRPTVAYQVSQRIAGRVAKAIATEEPSEETKGRHSARPTSAPGPDTGNTQRQRNKGATRSRKRLFSDACGSQVGVARLRGGSARGGNKVASSPPCRLRHRFLADISGFRFRVCVCVFAAPCSC